MNNACKLRVTISAFLYSELNPSMMDTIIEGFTTGYNVKDPLYSIKKTFDGEMLGFQIQLDFITENTFEFYDLSNCISNKLSHIFDDILSNNESKYIDIDPTSFKVACKSSSYEVSNSFIRPIQTVIHMFSLVGSVMLHHHVMRQDLKDETRKNNNFKTEVIAAINIMSKRLLGRELIVLEKPTPQEKKTFNSSIFKDSNTTKH